MKDLADYKSIITITCKTDIKKGITTITFASGTNKNQIKKALEGLTFCASDLTTGSAVEVSSPTTSYELQTFSVVTRHGAYARIPGTCTMQTVSPSRSWSDVSSAAWYKEDVDFVATRDMMTGVAYNTFAPNANVTRGQAITILYRLADMPSFKGGTAFEDVLINQWYTQAIFWASAEDIAAGLPNGKFGVHSVCTREDLALMLFNFAKYQGFKCTESAKLGKFKDAGMISVQNMDAMKWAVSVDIIRGSTGTTLSPKGTTTRAEMAAMMKRFVSYMVIPIITTN
ncbi:MAG: S-layer homology domain-containing protein [Angelakisella sp.]